MTLDKETALSLDVTTDASELVRSGPVPLYAQIAEKLSANIIQGMLPSGSSIGTEKELCNRFGVGRITLRHAVDILVKKNLVERKQGKGTYVRSTKLEFPLGQLKGTTQLASAAGEELASEVLGMRTVKGNEEPRRSLNLGDGENLTEIWRRDSSVVGPVALAIVHLPETYGQHLVKRELEETALYPLLESKFKISVETAHQKIQVDAATGAVAELLEVRVDDPLIRVNRITRDAEGQAVEYSVIFFRPESVRFSMELRKNLGSTFDAPL